MITHRQRAGLTRAGTAISLIGALCMVAAVAVSPASASGEFTTASLTSPLAGSATTFQWTYVFNQGNGQGLSNIAVRFCSSSIISHIVFAGPDADTFETGDVPGGHTGFGPGVKFELTAARGTFEITFDQPFSVSAVGLEVQSHSGNGQLGDIITTAGGPDSGCEPAATTTTVPTTTTAPPTTTTTVPPTTTTVPSTTTTVGPTTTTTTPPPTTTTVPATTTTLPEDPPTIPGT
ncbi:MAG TPA: hypothetical protein VG078_08300, partial [Acidimicrobiales bacterium]|nr:hypothetical protein [Acidimicrobiales bacterium]